MKDMGWTVLKEGGGFLAELGAASIVGTACGVMIATGQYKPFTKVCSVIGTVGLSWGAARFAGNSWRKEIQDLHESVDGIMEIYNAIKDSTTKEKGEEKEEVSAEALS